MGRTLGNRAERNFTRQSVVFGYNFAASSRKLAQDAQNSPTLTSCLGLGVGDATPEPRAIVIGLALAAARAAGRNERIAVAGADFDSRQN